MGNKNYKRREKSFLHSKQRQQEARIERLNQELTTNKPLEVEKCPT